MGVSLMIVTLAQVSTGQVAPFAVVCDTGHSQHSCLAHSRSKTTLQVM